MPVLARYTFISSSQTFQRTWFTFSRQSFELLESMALAQFVSTFQIGYVMRRNACVTEFKVRPVKIKIRQIIIETHLKWKQICLRNILIVYTSRNELDITSLLQIPVIVMCL